MPELPEVQTTIDGIRPYLVDKKILNCNISVKKLRWKIDKDICKNLANSKIIDVFASTPSSVKIDFANIVLGVPRII